ncbi:MAG: hypothetical protein ACYS8W_11325 [Planctomycetota bacterium]|jgi:hypothetical protein
MLSSVLTAGCEEDSFEAIFLYSISKSGKTSYSESVSTTLAFRRPNLTWFSASFSLGYVLNTWEDNISGTYLEYQSRGVSDATVSASINLTELVNPAAMLPDNRAHLVLSFGTSIPLGEANESYFQDQARIPGGLQTGTGEPMPYVSIIYSQTFDDAKYGPYIQLTQSARMSENEYGYQKPSGFSWLAGFKYLIWEDWSSYVFAGIGRSRTVSPETEKQLVNDPVLGDISVPMTVPGTPSISTSFNFGAVLKPFKKRHWCAGISFTLPIHSNFHNLANPDDAKDMEPKWGISMGITYSF